MAMACIIWTSVFSCRQADDITASGGYETTNSYKEGEKIKLFENASKDSSSTNGGGDPRHDTLGARIIFDTINVDEHKQSTTKP